LIHRDELNASQERLAVTTSTIRGIEVLNIANKKLAKAMVKRNAVLDQQTQMKQQKESAFLREIQLVKTRHLQQVK
jgi:hypothetical protein